jgi:DnaJ-class molecular chaperone
MRFERFAAMTLTPIESHYRLFGVTSGCDDDDLRRASHRAMRAHHPDLHPERLEEATATSQRLTSAYAELKHHREGGAVTGAVGTPASDFSDFSDFTATFGAVYPDMVDRTDIVRRKTAFRAASQAAWRHPGDALLALASCTPPSRPSGARRSPICSSPPS